MVAHLGILAAAGRAKIGQGLAHGRKNRFHAFKGRFVAAGHDGQRPLTGADVAAGNGSIQGLDALFLGLGIDFLGQGGTGRGHVDDKTALFTAKDAVFPEIDGLHVLGIADHGNDDVRLGSQFCLRIEPVTAFLDEFFCLGFRPRRDVDGIPRFL